MDIITFIIESDGERPIYEQLYEFIKLEIQLGKIPYNSKLPSKRKLSAYLKISQNTIQAAYGQLMEEGYIYSEERRGYFVNKISDIIDITPRKAWDKNEVIEKEMDIKYDFSYHGVDTKVFPFNIWRKLSKNVIDENDDELFRSSDPQGHINLRRSIANYLHGSRGVNCTPEQIIISAGTEFLFQILFQLFDEENIYGIENPGYEKLNMLFAGNKVRFKPINIDNEGIIVEDIIKSRANILCITPAHQFPSGEIMPINRKVQILNWANEETRRYIIEDDYDSEFKYSGRPMPALQGIDRNEKVIYMGSFSKSLSPALRVSYMVLPNHLLKKYKKKLTYIICPVPMMVQKILYKFIDKGHFERHLNRMRNVYKKKRELIIKNIEKFNSDIVILGADAGLHFLLKVNNGMSEEELVSSALSNSIKIHGISKYYFESKDIMELPIVIIGYGTMEEELIENAVSMLHKSWF